MHSRADVVRMTIVGGIKLAGMHVSGGVPTPFLLLVLILLQSVACAHGRNVCSRECMVKLQHVNWVMSFK